MAPAPRISTIRSKDIFSPMVRSVIRRAKWVIVQKRKSMQKPEAKPFIALIITGTLSTEGARMAARRASIIKRGAPGG